jgi:hypothetical protein
MHRLIRNKLGTSKPARHRILSLTFISACAESVLSNYASTLNQSEDALADDALVFSSRKDAT